jgi:hypothetical protein
LSKGLVESITEFFKPQASLWACELTSKHVIVAGVNGGRNRIADKWTADLPEAGDGGVEAIRPALREVLSQGNFKGSEIAVVVPDDTARIAILTVERAAKNAEEQRTFIRWKLKKSVPFDVETAQVAYRMLGPHRSGSGIDMLVALSPRSVVQEYESLFDAMDIHAGVVLPSTLAALNLLTPAAGDALFVKVAPDCITTTVFQNKRVQFYRRVTDVSLYDAVYPTLLYYQDKLGGKTFERLFVCGYDSDQRFSLDAIQERLGLTAQRLEPKSVDDIYKPALGALHLKPEAVV